MQMLRPASERQEHRSYNCSPEEHLAIQPYNIPHQNPPVQFQHQVSPTVWSRNMAKNQDHHQKSSEFRVPACMDCLEAAAICACICFQSAGGKLIIVKRL